MNAASTELPTDILHSPTYPGIEDSKIVESDDGKLFGSDS